MKKILIVLGVAVVLAAAAGAYYWYNRGAEPTSNEPVSLTEVNVFFNNDFLDPSFSCDKVFPVSRKVPLDANLPKASLQFLLAGPIGDEPSKGYSSAINSGVRLNSLEITEGVARADFDEQMNYQVAGSCRVLAIRAQITETLKQFPQIQEVIISVNGNTEEILQP